MRSVEKRHRCRRPRPQRRLTEFGLWILRYILTYDDWLTTEDELIAGVSSELKKMRAVERKRAKRRRA